MIRPCLIAALMASAGLVMGLGACQAPWQQRQVRQEHQVLPVRVLPELESLPLFSFFSVQRNPPLVA